MIIKYSANQKGFGIEPLKPYTAGKISTENLLDNVLTYISEHFCFYTLCIICAYKYVKKLRKCK